jgi:hypothetical protein
VLFIIKILENRVKYSNHKRKGERKMERFLIKIVLGALVLTPTPVMSVTTVDSNGSMPEIVQLDEAEVVELAEANTFMIVETN